MTETTFDTLATAETLAAAGASEPLARAIANTVRDGHGELATKTDLADLRAGIELATKADLANLRADIFRALWLQVGAIVAIHVGLAGLAFALANVIVGAGQ